jgi:hypothetical protein
MGDGGEWLRVALRSTAPVPVGSMFMANRERWVGSFLVFHCIRTAVLRAWNALPLLRYLESLVPGMAVGRANGVLHPGLLFLSIVELHLRYDVLLQPPTSYCAHTVGKQATRLVSEKADVYVQLQFG